MSELNHFDSQSSRGSNRTPPGPTTKNTFEGYDNPFCVLRLSSDSTGSEIQLAAQRAVMERRLSGDSDRSKFEIDVIENALEVLKDPMSRFTASLNWVTLNAEEHASWTSSSLMQGLSFDRKITVGTGYEKIASASSVAVRSHNIAVLACADAHRLAISGDVEEAANEWARGFQNWGICLSSDEFKMRTHERARSLDDPRLIKSTVEFALDSIPHNLLSIPSSLASLALEKRKTAEAAGIIDLIRDAPFESQILDRALEMIYRPLAHRIETEIDSLDKRRQAYSDSNEEASDSVFFDGIFDEFVKHIAPDLDQMLELGDLPGLAEEHARDHASKFLEKLGINAWNIADDSTLAQKCTKLASHYADASSLKIRFNNSLATLEDQELLGDEFSAKLKKELKKGEAQAIEWIRACKREVKSSESIKYLDGLIAKLSDQRAVTLFESSITLAQLGDRDGAIEMLLEAQKWSSDVDTKQQIGRCISSLRSSPRASVAKQAAHQGVGCLIQIVAIGIVVGIISLISGNY